MISEDEKPVERVLFTCPSEIIFWQLTGSGEDFLWDFLSRKLSKLESGILYNAETDCFNFMK